MDEITYTHKGWFGLCPVYIAEPLANDPWIDARYPCTDWLIDLSALFFRVFVNRGADDYPTWAIRVTGELEDPIVVEYER